MFGEDQPDAGVGLLDSEASRAGSAVGHHGVVELSVGYLHSSAGAAEQDDKGGAKSASLGVFAIDACICRNRAKGEPGGYASIERRTRRSTRIATKARMRASPNWR